jgi:hypothetical protein
MGTARPRQGPDLDPVNGTAGQNAGDDGPRSREDGDVDREDTRENRDDREDAREDGEDSEDREEGASSGRAEASVAERPDPNQPCPKEDEGCRSERLGEINLGPLHLGLTGDELVALYGEPATRQRLEEMGATGMWVGDWTWPKLGIVVQMGATSEKGPIAAEAFTVEAPFGEATDRGIKIGDPVAKVAKAYGDVYDPLGSRKDDLYVAGSLFGGILFRHEAGKVTSIFVGAAAE